MKLEESKLPPLVLIRKKLAKHIFELLLDDILGESLDQC
jgi:hypothetical protein